MSKLEQLEVAIAELPHDCAVIKKVATKLLEQGSLDSLLTYAIGVRDGFDVLAPNSQSLSVVRKIVDILL